MHISPQSSPIPASLILGSAEIVSETHVTAHSQPETQIPAFADTVAHEPIPVDIQLIPGSRIRDTSPVLIKNELSPITIPAPIGGAENPTMSRNAGDDPALSLMPGFVNDNVCIPDHLFIHSLMSVCSNLNMCLLIAYTPLCQNLSIMSLGLSGQLLRQNLRKTGVREKL